MWFDHLACAGNELRVDDYCTHDTWAKLTDCNHTADIGVGCDHPTEETSSFGYAYQGIRIITIWGEEVYSLGEYLVEGRVEIRKDG